MGAPRKARQSTNRLEASQVQFGEGLPAKQEGVREWGTVKGSGDKGHSDSPGRGCPHPQQAKMLPKRLKSRMLNLTHCNGIVFSFAACRSNIAAGSFRTGTDTRAPVAFSLPRLLRDFGARVRNKSGELCHP